MRRALLLFLAIFLSISLVAPAEAKFHGSSHSARNYQVYTKTHPRTGKVYVGRTSGTGSPAANLRRRDANHHRNSEGYGRAQLKETSKNKDAIRGREQQRIEKNRAEGRAADQINGVSPKNKKRDHYLREADKEFGKL